MDVRFVTVILLLIAASAAVLVGSQIAALQRNARLAKSTGLPYFLAPFAFLETRWLILEPIILPLLKILPERYTRTWLPLSILIEIWRAAYLPFAQAGVDTFLIVTPTGLNLWTCDAAVNEQILAATRRDDFPKSVDLLGVMDTWGPSLPASVGEDARVYRRVAGPCFNEETHKRVWTYGINRTGTFLEEKRLQQQTTDGSEDSEGLIPDLVQDCKTWVSEFNAPAKSLKDAFLLDSGFCDTDFIGYLRRLLPIRRFNEAYLAYTEWYKHLYKLRQVEKERQLKSDGQTSSSNILETLVASEAEPGQPTTIQADGTPRISTAALYGNISNFVVAGHETTANTLAFIVTMLALNPDTQSQLHQELDSIFGLDRIGKPDTWSFEADFPRLLNGILGAIQNETMRLFPLLPTTPRITGSTQALLVNGKTCLIPAGCHCFPNTPATHTNPKYWGAVLPQNNDVKLYNESRSLASREYIITHKLAMWDPMRWLSDKVESHKQSITTNPQRPLTDSLLQPGTFLPFSRGPRACIGKRFAQVEICAFIARLFAQHEVRVARVTQPPETELEAIQRTREQITIRATTTMTYRAADGIRLSIIPRQKHKTV